LYSSNAVIFNDDVPERMRGALKRKPSARGARAMSVTRRHVMVLHSELRGASLAEIYTFTVWCQVDLSTLELSFITTMTL
jgi:hypothetical protein